MSKQMAELKALKDKELDDRIADFKKELVKLNAQVATGTIPKKPTQIKNIKKNIARIFFLKRQRELENLKTSISKVKTEKVKSENIEKEKRK